MVSLFSGELFRAFDLLQYIGKGWVKSLSAKADCPKLTLAVVYIA
jgi:hypothetical protein